MKYRDVLPSDGDWSDDDDNDDMHLIDDEMDDHNDVQINEPLQPLPETMKPFYRVGSIRE